MKKETDYYTAPSQEIFEDVKTSALKICKDHGFSQEKIDRIDGIQNIRDNCSYIVGMFDQVNQARLLVALKPPARKWLAEILKNN